MHLLAKARRGLLFTGLALAAAGCAVPAAEDSPTYVVFFTAQSADLDAPALEVLGEAAATAQANPGRGVTVAGYADKIGTPQANQILSHLRAQVVADGLAARGVDKGRIHIRPKGATGGDPGIESRRVEVVIGR